MEIKVSFLIITFLTIIIHSSGQRFMVRLGHFRQPYLNQTEIRCTASLISLRHSLTTASCVIVEAPTLIAINIEIVTLIPDGGNTTSSILVPAGRVFIHPHYDYIQNFSNNAAIVTTNIFVNNPQFGFVPRSLGALSTSGSCNLFGWGGELLEPRRDAVVINAPQSCDPNFPQSFCTIFDSALNPTCNASLGSPVTCGNDTIVAGFLINDEGCDTNAGRTTLNYHSVDHFRDWIEGVVGPELPERDPIDFIVTVMQFTSPVLTDITPRCFGTIITSNRVLTTASCASIESPFSLAVQTRIVQGSSSTAVTVTASRVYIYPEYRQEHPFVNNVAIIEVSGRFDESIVPRSLGSLQSNSTCQLFGWGPSSIGFTRSDPVTVFGPQYCNSSLPQALCSNHPTIFHYSCEAMTGSPVTCGNETIIDGFLINNASCSTNEDGHVSLNYHSVGQFSEWILEHTGATTTTPPTTTREPNTAVITKISTVFIVFVVVLGILN